MTGWPWIGAALLAGSLLLQPAQAAPSAADFARLGKALTPVGAERAGNREGTIPEWTGGQCTPPPGYKPMVGKHGFPYVDEYAGDKPRFSVTAANLAEHEAQLDAAQKLLLKTYPSYRLDVYPTRRTACHPEWVYRNTIERAGRPRLVGDAPGLADAHAQVPFPIPQNGLEAMWNAITPFHPVYFQGEFDSWLADSNGRRTLITDQILRYRWPYWDNTRTSSEELTSLHSEIYAPAANSGRMDLRTQWLRMDQREPRAWLYTPGQRRVRLAPEFNYDTPLAQYSGLAVYDEVNGFDGKMDRFDFQLVGKKEMLVPYNALKYLQATTDEIMSTLHHPNPDTLRWELHRVWVIEATRKPGVRHAYQKKVFYLDEDSWLILLYNSFDDQGRLHRSSMYPLYQAYDVPMPHTQNVTGYDHLRGGWYQGARPTAGKPGWRQVESLPESYFNADGMSAMGVR